MVSDVKKAAAEMMQPRDPDDKHVLVLGAGNFGTCLASHLAALGNQVVIWARDQKVVDSINYTHQHSKYLKGIELSDNLTAVSQLTAGLFEQATVVVVAIPTQSMRYLNLMRFILQSIKGWVEPSHLLIFVNKGIEISSGTLPHDIATEILGEEKGYNATFLSGPSFAIEVAQRQPTCVAVASQSQERGHRTQRLFHAPCFRVYDIDDPVGLEIAGALKNVIAIASGACAGAGFQLNARAALITRGLAEITRFGIALGANPLTFAGLSGVGDLFLTCTSEKSRNFTVGYRLGQGESLEYICESLGSTAEGVTTTEAAYEMARKLNIDSPITDAVYSVLYQGKDYRVAMLELMSREPSKELRGIVDSN